METISPLEQISQNHANVQNVRYKTLMWLKIFNCRWNRRNPQTLELKVKVRHQIVINKTGVCLFAYKYDKSKTGVFLHE